MDLIIESNREAALFHTVQDVLDCYQPEEHIETATIVQETGKEDETVVLAIPISDQWTEKAK